MNKDTKIYLILGIIVIGIIVSIYFYRSYSSSTLNETTAKCIGSRSLLIASRTCGHCVTQEEMIKDYINYFNISYVEDDISLWSKYQLSGTPTWIINNKTYPGVRSIKELKKLTGC